MFQKILSFVFSSWVRIRSVLLPVQVFQGIPSEGCARFTFAYIGWDKRKLSYFLSSLYQSFERVPGKRYIPVWKIEYKTKALSDICDMALLEIDSEISKKCARNIYGFLLPRWLKMFLDVDKSFEIFSDKRNHIRRMVRKYDLSLNIGTSEEDFRFFYERMYKPYIQARHKGSAVIESFETMFNHPRMESARILFVVHEGKRIGGVYEQFFEGLPYLNAVGILDGSQEYRKLGAVSATYYFAVEEYKRNQIPRVDIGGTSPLLMDGLTKFKIAIGAKVSKFECQDSVRVKLLLLNYSPGLSSYLTNSGFVHLDQDQVRCALFQNRLSEESDPDFEKQVRHANAMEIDHLEFIKITP